MKKILLTGGGTAGHVTPNIALLSKLRELGLEVHYAGSKKGIERELMGREGVPYHPLSAGKLRRYFDLKNFTDLFRIAAGFFQALVLILRIKPLIIFSKGGFVSCPVVWAGSCLKIPVVIHESDMTPGLANKLSIPFAAKVCYSFPETGKYLPSGKGVHTGLPVRQSLFNGKADEGRKLCGFTDSKPVLMVIGGSQGSQVVNAAVRSSLADLLKKYNICHICGKGNLGEINPGYAQFEYVNEELPHLFALADLVISRSGATTLFELFSLRKANLLIPLGSNASRGDQILNAESFVRQGFSRVLSQDHLTPSTLVKSVEEAFGAREEMKAAMEKSRLRDGVEAVVNVIIDTLK
ncbi:MAG: undecaprenyldiphospho-muramoylpentapeptide beta-N-acetylglucosaminyltransferase [Fibrobacter sp.]|nr:undecaprenyldiphospho-muramoylpentapeptide beta-N-acetylglucosaminyltransferase [Fibrobacter sp.]